MQIFCLFLFWFCIIYTAVVDILIDFSKDFCILNFLRDDFRILIVTSYFLCSGVKRVKMTYFGHFNFWLLFLNLKLICPGIRKTHETYVARGGGVQRVSIFFWKQPQAYYAKPKSSSCFIRWTTSCLLGCTRLTDIPNFVSRYRDTQLQVGNNYLFVKFASSQV